ncbi:hypothetical protein LTS15_003286 [Exophiala xenobiotica]|nr:hypothetical protein LTS15_003286 [Exophiala xenobiotica]
MGILLEDKMPGEREYSNSEETLGADATDNNEPPTQLRRQVSLYDAVAGRVGQQGFLTMEQLRSSALLPVAPEDYLLQQTRIPAEIFNDNHDVGGELAAARQLPESEMLKAIHTYASDLYNSATMNKGSYDFRSLDETALIAVGILLEEAVKEALGETGDMVFVEPEGLEKGLGETTMTRHQIKGRVQPRVRATELSEEEDIEQDESPAKRPRH